MIHHNNNFFKGLLICALVNSLIACSPNTNETSADDPLPDAASRGALLLKQKCSSCHAAPHPSSRPAKLWPSIMIRMQGLRRTQGYSPIAEEDVKILTEYLQRYASDKK